MEFILFPSTKIFPTQHHLFQDIKVLRPSQLRHAAEVEAKERGKAHDAARGISAVSRETSLSQDGSHLHRGNETRSSGMVTEGNPYYPTPPEHEGLVSGNRLRQLCLSQLKHTEVEMAKTVHAEHMNLICIQPPLPLLYGYDVWSPIWGGSPSFFSSSSSSLRPSSLMPSGVAPSEEEPVNRPQLCVLKALRGEEVGTHYFHISELLQPHQLFLFTCWDNLEVFAQAYELLCGNASVGFPLPCMSFPTSSTSLIDVVGLPDIEHDDEERDIGEEEGEEREGERYGEDLLENSNNEEVVAQEGLQREDSSSLLALASRREEEEGKEITFGSTDSGGPEVGVKHTVGEDGGEEDSSTEVHSTTTTTILVGEEGEMRINDEQQIATIREGTVGSAGSSSSASKVVTPSTTQDSSRRFSPTPGKSTPFTTATSLSVSSSSSASAVGQEFPSHPLHQGSSRGTPTAASGSASATRGVKRGREEGSTSTAAGRLSPSTTRNTTSVFPSNRRGREDLGGNSVSSIIQPVDFDIFNEILDEEMKYIKEMAEEEGEEEETEEEEEEEEEDTGGPEKQSWKERGVRFSPNAAQEGDNEIEQKTNSNGNEKQMSSSTPLLLSPVLGRVIAPFLCQVCHHFPSRTLTMSCCGAVTCYRCSMMKDEHTLSAEASSFPPSIPSSARLCPVCQEEPISPPLQHPQRDKRLHQLIRELKVLYFPQFQQWQRWWFDRNGREKVSPASQGVL